MIFQSQSPAPLVWLKIHLSQTGLLPVPLHSAQNKVALAKDRYVAEASVRRTVVLMLGEESQLCFDVKS